jgi:hypothetical protein
MVLDRPPILLRLEGIAATVLGVVLYRELGSSWWLFAILALAPDLSMLGYLVGNRIGAMAYNAAHALVLPMALAVAGVLTDSTTTVAIALIWLIHIAVDRALGYGLKLPTGFQDTHMGVVGQGARG